MTHLLVARGDVRLRLAVHGRHYHASFPPSSPPVRRAIIQGDGAGVGGGISGGGDSIAEPVWDLYAHAVGRFGPTPVIPGHSRRVYVWPVAGAAVWMATLALGSRGEWTGSRSPLVAPDEWACVAVIVFGGAPLVAMMGRALRRGAPLNPALTGAFAALSIAVLANVVACVSDPHVDHAVTLVWHGAAILVVVAVVAAGAPFVLTWNAAARR